MENLNENQTNPQNTEDLSKLKTMFSDYEKEATKTSRRKSSEEILAKYFVPRKTKEIFRILPPKLGHDYIDKAFFHVVPTTIAGGKTKHNTVLYCPAHNDPKVPKIDKDKNPVLDTDGKQVMTPAPCSLCKKHKSILIKQDPSLKGKKKDDLNENEKKIWEKNREIFIEANKWQAKKFYIVRGVDKGNQKDGVKFWRFKHNFKKQGTYDKLMPVLNEYVDYNQVDFTHPIHGTDLSITMADTEWNGMVYKQISAITTRGKSKLHEDSIVVRQWLEDDIIWRDVFKPKSAPNITPHQYLEFVAEGNAPYWDDTDANNKHWVFPNNPELQEAANTRRLNLDDDKVDENFEQASDLTNKEESHITVSNVTVADVGKDKDSSIEIGEEVKKMAAEATSEISDEKSSEKTQKEKNNQSDDSVDEPTGDYDDLPF